MNLEIASEIFRTMYEVLESTAVPDQHNKYAVIKMDESVEASDVPDQQNEEAVESEVFLEGDSGKASGFL